MSNFNFFFDLKLIHCFVLLIKESQPKKKISLHQQST
jgi:hypothetical protein